MIAFIIICTIVGCSGSILFFIMYSKKAKEVRSSNRKDFKSGRQVRRNLNFYENTQEYTIKKFDKTVLFENLKNENLGIKITYQENENGIAIYFEDVDYNASLTELKCNVEDKQKLKFWFHNRHKETYSTNSIDIHNRMNRLLTSVDRSILKIDPYTTVTLRKHYMKTKSHSTFI